MKENINEKFYLFLEEYHISLNMKLIECAKNIGGHFKNEDYYTITSINSEKKVVEEFLKYFNSRNIRNANKDYFFNEFSYLSKFLLISNLSPREMLLVALEVIKRNIDADLLKSSKMLVHEEGFREYKFKQLSIDEVKVLLSNLNEEMFDLKKSKIFADVTVSKKEELIDFLRKYSIDISDLINNHQIIYDNYFKKIGKYDDKNIDEVINAFSRLGVTNELCSILSEVLNKKYKKRCSSTIEINLKKEDTTNKDVLLSDKEYKSIRKELSNYIDLYHNTSVKALNGEEKERCIYLLLKLGKNDFDIENILRRIEWDYPSCEMEYLVSDYAKVYSKLLYYKEKLYSTDEINDLNDIINAMISSNDEDYVFWKSEFISNFRNLYKKIQNEYEYEIDSVKDKMLVKIK